MARSFVYSLIFLIYINFQIQPLESLNQHQFKYGDRKSGDRRKAHVDNEHKWLTRFNQTNIRCPSEGSYEFKITYVEITTQSSSSYANYKVIDGGIGQKFIEVNVETEFIDCISYDGYVYGGSSAALPSLGLLAAIIALTFFLPK